MQHTSLPVNANIDGKARVLEVGSYRAAENRMVLQYAASTCCKATAHGLDGPPHKLVEHLLG